MAKAKTIEDWIEAGVPKARLARKIGFSRNALLAYLEPSKYAIRLGDDALTLIAKFEGRSLKVVRETYHQRCAAAAA